MIARILTVLAAMILIPLGGVAGAQPEADTGVPNVAPLSDKHLHLRFHLDNSRARFEREKKGHVAFLGGSITEMNGYRPMVAALLKERFPETDFTFTNAGIASTCSTTGAFRLKTDVLDKGTVDLLLIEFAVNDDQDAAHAKRDCVRGMEGIIRQALRHNPKMDIVVTYFVNPGMLEQIQEGKTPLSMAAHERVAKHYQVSTVWLAHEVAEQIDKGKLTWQQFGGTHPAPHGNALAARMIDRLFEKAWSKPRAKDDQPSPHPLPKKPLDAGSYFNGRFVNPKHVKVTVKGWSIQTPDWKTLPGSKRDRFTSMPMLCATEPGATLTLTFEGAAVGAYVVAGPDAGILLASIDGGAFVPVDLYHRFSRGLHYPRTVMFAADLEPGEHVLRLRVSDQRNEASQGHAARIMWFCLN